MNTNSRIIEGICQHFEIYTDNTEWLAQCETCHERHYFRSEYFAKDWANKHSRGVDNRVIINT